MFVAHIEANMPDDETAAYLADDTGWVQAQWPECVRQAEEADNQVTGTPVLQYFNFKSVVQDGNIYDFVFHVPTVDR